MKKRAQIFFIILIFVIFLSVSRFFSHSLVNQFHQIFSPIEKQFYEAGQRSKTFFSQFFGVFHISKIKKENELLKQENIFLLQKLNELREVKKENDFLKSALAFAKEKNFNILSAQIVSYRANQDVILIDKGKEDNLIKGMPVVTVNNVVVGKIKEVFDNFSEVVLITNNNFSFDVKIQLNDTEQTVALAKGEGNKNLTFDLAPKEKEIPIESLVFTSVLGGSFPPGLLVGKITQVQKNDAQPFQKGVIKPYFPDFLQERVIIITKF